MTIEGGLLFSDVAKNDRRRRQFASAGRIFRPLRLLRGRLLFLRWLLLLLLRSRDGQFRHGHFAVEDDVGRLPRFLLEHNFRRMTFNSLNLIIAVDVDVVDVVFGAFVRRFPRDGIYGNDERRRSVREGIARRGRRCFARRNRGGGRRNPTSNLRLAALAVILPLLLLFGVE